MVDEKMINDKIKSDHIPQKLKAELKTVSAQFTFIEYNAGTSSVGGGEFPRTDKAIEFEQTKYQIQ